MGMQALAAFGSSSGGGAGRRPEGDGSCRRRWSLEVEMHRAPPNGTRECYHRAYCALAACTVVLCC